MFKAALLAFVTLACAAAPPPLREQVSLNGTWPLGGKVPVYQGEPIDTKTYEREVAVPTAWAGRIVKVEFENVAFVADVYVNGEHAARHVGAWNPFAVDVTRWAQPGRSFRLRVEVSGPQREPIVDGKGAFQWPVGGWGAKKLGGIAGDVVLRAFGPVYIDDAFIQTSFREKRLAVEYTICNGSANSRTVEIAAEAALASGKGARRTLRSRAVALAPGETRTITVSVPWRDPILWWPDRPALYHLTSRVLESGNPLDEETRRFGFREIWIEGNQFRFNGVRVNLFGDYQVFGDTWYTRPEIYTPENWPTTVDRIKAMNIRILRWHRNPVPQYVLDVTDEKGLLICDESANYARPYHKNSNHAAYLENARRWIPAWIRADRNHPSVYMWNVTNEMTYKFAGPFDAKELEVLGGIIRRLDPTRPIGYDGDAPPVDGELVDYHYPEGYNKEPQGSIYSWAKLVKPDRPTGAGEMLHTKSPLKEVQTAIVRNTWWLGIWTRGLRYTNWTNVKPACYWFAAEDGFEGPRAENLRNAYAPVALFDKEYDDLGITPYVTGTTPGGVLPRVEAGAPFRRTLILYNDEFRGEIVRAEALLRTGGAVHARWTKQFRVGLGDHIQIPCSLRVPAVPGKTLEFVLRTYKDGVQKFEEIRRFMVVSGDSGASGVPQTRLRDAELRR